MGQRDPALLFLGSCPDLEYEAGLEVSGLHHQLGGVAGWWSVKGSGVVDNKE